MEYFSYTYIIGLNPLVSTTRTSPHETREANLMRLRRNIDVAHFQLDDKGTPKKVTSDPNVTAGQ